LLKRLNNNNLGTSIYPLNTKQKAQSVLSNQIYAESKLFYIWCITRSVISWNTFISLELEIWIAKYPREPQK
jgi:hypothetical protein